MAKKVKITLKKSPMGERPKTRATVRSLGLRRIRQTVEHVDSPDLRGMLARVQHLVDVE